MAQWLWLRGQGLTVKMTAGEDFSDTFLPVTVSNGQVVMADDGDEVFGVCKNKPSQGETAVVIVSNDVFRCQAVGDLSPGSVVYLEANAQVGAGEAGEVSCGIVVDFDPSNNGECHVLAQFAAADRTTHA